MKTIVVRCGAQRVPPGHVLMSRPLTAKYDQVWSITGWRRPGGLELGHRVQLTLTQHPQGAAGALRECERVGVGGWGGRKCGRLCSRC